MKIANNKASLFTSRKQEFQGSNTFGTWGKLSPNGIPARSVYTVYSYGYHFPMYVFKAGIWYENGDKYSQTTSKQQNQLRPSIDGAFIVTTTEKMKSLIN